MGSESTIDAELLRLFSNGHHFVQGETINIYHFHMEADSLFSLKGNPNILEP